MSKANNNRTADRMSKLAAHFTPGAIVRSYYGHDRVIAFNAGDANGYGWSVRVIACNSDGSPMSVDRSTGLPVRERTHCTTPAGF